MAGIFGELLTRKHREREDKEGRAANFYGSVVRDYFAGKSDLDDDSAQFAISEFQKLLPKDSQESFQQFIHAKLAQRLPGTPKPQGGNGGLPTPSEPSSVSGNSPGLPPPPTAMSGEAAMMNSEINNGPAAQSLPQPPTQIPLPPAMAQASALGQQGFSQSTPSQPAPAARPTAQPAQLPPPPFMRRNPMDQSALQVAAIQSMVEEAKAIGLSDPKDISNFINNKQIDRDPAKKGLQGFGPGTMVFDDQGALKHTVPFKEDPYKEVSAGAALYDTRTGQPVFQAPAKPNDPTSAFGAWYQRFQAENGRPPTVAEIKAIEQQFSPSYGPPPVVIAGPGGVPTYVPRGEAMGKAAPRTVFDAQGNASTGGVQGVSLSPPPNVSDRTQQDLASNRAILGQYQAVAPNLDKLVQGPLAGRVTLAEVEKLGGIGAAPEEVEAAVRLRNLVRSQAFLDGGKQLTGTEKEEFIATTPALTDTVQQAAIKAKVAMEILDRNYKTRLGSMPARQRNQIPGQSGDGLPPPPGQGGRIRVRNKQTGQTGTISEGNFDASKYDRI